MDKSAPSVHGIHKILEKRWSPRAFSEQSVEPEKLRRIFEAMQWAPSSYNEQPWRIIVGVKGQGETWNNLAECISEWNRKWAISAPVLMLICGKTGFSHKEMENNVFTYDAGQAAAYMTFQLTHEGLFAHQMGGIIPHKARELFCIPEGYEPVTAMAVGYIGDLDRIPEEYHAEEIEKRTRKPLGEIVFEEEWGQGHGLAD